jgi:hypothetical protein
MRWLSFLLVVISIYALCFSALISYLQEYILVFSFQVLINTVTAADTSENIILLINKVFMAKARLINQLDYSIHS